MGPDPGDSTWSNFKASTRDMWARRRGQKGSTVRLVQRKVSTRLLRRAALSSTDGDKAMAMMEVMGWGQVTPLPTRWRGSKSDMPTTCLSKRVPSSACIHHSHCSGEGQSKKICRANRTIGRVKRGAGTANSKDSIQIVSNRHGQPWPSRGRCMACSVLLSPLDRHKGRAGVCP